MYLTSKTFEYVFIPLFQEFFLAQRKDPNKGLFGFWI